MRGRAFDTRGHVLRTVHPLPRIDHAAWTTRLLRKHVACFEPLRVGYPAHADVAKCVAGVAAVRQQCVTFRVWSLKETFRLVPPSETPGSGPAPQLDGEGTVDQP